MIDNGWRRWRGRRRRLIFRLRRIRILIRRLWIGRREREIGRRRKIIKLLGKKRDKRIKIEELSERRKEDIGES